MNEETKTNILNSVELMFKQHNNFSLPKKFPQYGLGEVEALEELASGIFTHSARLDLPSSLAHMDPPTPWVTWVSALWNASLNQNMIHAETSPFAQEAEKLVLKWLSPYFGMDGGHFCSGSTLANLTALWVARDLRGIKKVVCSTMAHISIEKACKILNLELVKVDTNNLHVMKKPDFDLSKACLVLTAGTTGVGAIDPFEFSSLASWTHIDGAWAGGLRFSEKYGHLLDGVEKADSFALSCHKMLLQPKDSAVILFKNTQKAQEVLSMGSDYLLKPNIGIQGSRGASVINLLVTLLAYGQDGIEKTINILMENAKILHEFLKNNDKFEVFNSLISGINVFRHVSISTEELYKKLPNGMFSTLKIDGKLYLRSVSANPNVNMEEIIGALKLYM